MPHSLRLVFRAKRPATKIAPVREPIELGLRHLRRYRAEIVTQLGGRFDARVAQNLRRIECTAEIAASETALLGYQERIERILAVGSEKG